MSHKRLFKQIEDLSVNVIFKRELFRVKERLAMNGIIIFLGFAVLIAGIIIAVSNPVEIMTKLPEMGTRRLRDPLGEIYEEPYVIKPAEYETIYPYAVAGGIVCLIGVITAIIGFAMPENKRQDIQQPM